MLFGAVVADGAPDGGSDNTVLPRYVAYGAAYGSSFYTSFCFGLHGHSGQRDCETDNYKQLSHRFSC